jgi:hypothetical protein
MVASVLTPLQLNAGAGLLQNQGLAPNAELVTVIADYNSTALIAPLLDTITVAKTGNILSPGNLDTLETLASATCPALSNSVPDNYPSLPVSNDPPGLTGVLTDTANTYMGNGDLSKFVQALSIADGYASQTNTFVNSAVNSQTYLGGTFTTTNDMITGDITTVNLATPTFAQDLANLGNLIDLNNLDNLGTPLALVQRIVAIVGNVPVLSVYFIEQGVPGDVVINLNNPTVSVTDSVQKLMYEAMLRITGEDLAQILRVIGVTTTGIATMADLLNPLRLFPLSFQSLTAPTAQGPRAIYINNTGSVNSSLANELPLYVISSLS